MEVAAVDRSTTTRTDAQPTRYVLLCDGCANEAGAADTSNIVGPGPELHGAACEVCGATFAGFAHRVRADAYVGMNPGPG